MVKKEAKVPRERAKLTDKQERMLVQCQLMGLTTDDIRKISNRLTLLEKEKKQRESVSQALEGLSWSQIVNKAGHVRGWKITNSDGLEYHCLVRSLSNWVAEYDITIYGADGHKIHGFLRKPRDRIQTIRGFPKKLLPDRSAELHTLLAAIGTGRIRP
jgi:hypothetical protein